MRTATGQDSTAGLERIQGTFTSWTVCLRDRSESRELLALGRFRVQLAGLEAIHSRPLLLLGLFWLRGRSQSIRELLPGSVFLCSSDEAPTWKVTRAAHLLDCLSVGLVSRDFIGKSWSLSRGKFFGRSLMSSPWREVDILSSFKTVFPEWVVFDP